MAEAFKLQFQDARERTVNQMPADFVKLGAKLTQHEASRMRE